MKTNRKRSLVLTNEGQNHPFRMTLSPALLATISPEEAENDNERKKENSWGKKDLQLFLGSFAAFFTAFYLFIF